MAKNPEIARLKKYKDCGHVFRSEYYDFDVQCPKCGSKNVKSKFFDPILDLLKY